MSDRQTERRWDLTDLLFEVGRLVQCAALTLRRHRIVAAQQVCECGRLPLRTLPLLGPRCEVAATQWERALDAMRQLLRHAVIVRRPGDG